MGAGGTVVVSTFMAAVAGFALYRWVQAARPPAPSLRCANCPRLARTIRALQLGAAGLAGLWVVTLVWALSR